jgi:TetR/AcrR family transcriptional regulator
MPKLRRPIVRRRPGRPCRDEPDGALLLLQAAQSTFARDGFKVATLRKIAAAAGVDHALAVHRFGSKESLWNAVIEHQAIYLAPFIAELRDLGKQTKTPILVRLEIALRQMVAATFGNPECGMLLSRISSERGEKLDTLVEKLLRPHYNAFYPLLLEAERAGVVRGHQLKMLYFMLLQAVTMTVSHRHVLEYFDGTSEDMLRLKQDMTQLLIESFLHRPLRGAGK